MTHVGLIINRVVTRFLTLYEKTYFAIKDHFIKDLGLGQ